LEEVRDSIPLRSTQTATGRSNREIAERLVVTLDTVKKHLTHIFGKLDAGSRAQAIARARDLKLIP
jgi:LuxR family maltose regulon positive regulatory protein